MGEVETARHGVLLVNLGTPDSPSVRDVRRYLDEFLSDPRVLDINPVARVLLAKLVILPFRGPASAARYRAIWGAEGSPLLAHGVRLRDRLQARLGPDYHAAIAMRYGNPSLRTTIEGFRRLNLETLTVIPLFPQYASASTGSVLDLAAREVAAWRTIPELRLVSGFHANPGMLRAWADLAAAHAPRSFDHVLFSFHGVPERQLRNADPGGHHCLRTEGCCDDLGPANRSCYRAQCRDTGRRLATLLDVPADRWTLCFQSRLGRDAWTRPATVDVLRDLARAGARKVLVFSPSFVADCLETLHEIRVELAAEFRAAGGQALTLVESLNEHPLWVEALAGMVVLQDPQNA